ncbi:MAG: SAM-dependent methyltransferase [Bacteroidetes bacterium]|nr:MAG: SAM-dependent methyltransferase [Bacteroidota bacterium]
MANQFHQRKIILTDDGSYSVLLPNHQVSYHSKHGAIQESKHVFIDSGLKPILKEKKIIHAFEMGFGTGLNALLTLIETEKENAKIHYTAFEAYPLDMSDAEKLNYCQQLQVPSMQNFFIQMHSSAWNAETMITADFFLHKILGDFTTYDPRIQFDLVYFDAFDPSFQPELWTALIFRKIHAMMNPGGVLVTYSSRKSVRNAMEEAGFAVSKLPGPPHKREIVKAIALSVDS